MVTMPDAHADVVVIGGGIVGCATAYYLARRRAKVVLVERGDLAGGQSSRAWGFVRQQGRDPREMPLMIACNRMWPHLSAELKADIEWVQGGNLVLAADGRRMDECEKWLPVARDFGVDTRLVSAAEVKRLIPDLHGRWVGGMYTASDGHAEPRSATLAFARAAAALGAKLYTSCAARGIEVTNGQVTAVVADNKTIKTSVVVCAAGAWSGAFARRVGLSLPLLTVRASVAETAAASPITDIGVWAAGVAFRQRRSGSFYIAPSGESDYYVSLDTLRHLRLFLPNYLKNWRLVRLRVGMDLAKELAGLVPVRRARPGAVDVAEPTPSAKEIDGARRDFVELFPALSALGLQRTWAGDIDVTPDAVPVLGPVERPTGFFFATGFTGHGFAMAPIVGLALSELILDGRSSVDIHPLRYARFREHDLAQPKNVV
jgi:glycine/D-amino acid oxidase-like deaminating enzyme